MSLTALDMEKHVPNPHTSLNIGQLMQSGFDFQSNSGPKTHFVAVLKALHARGHQVLLLALQGDRQVIGLHNARPGLEKKALGISGHPLFRLLEGGIRFIQDKLNLPYFGLFDSFRFREVCLKHLSHCDVFHERYSLMSLGGIWAAHKLSIPLILEVHADIINIEMPLHGKPLRGFQHFLAEMTTRQCFRHASKIVVVSEPVGNRLQSYWQVPAEKIVTVPLGADLDLFDSVQVYPGVRNELGLDDEPIVMFTGSFQPWHGLDKLVEAFAGVVSNVPGVKLVLVGDGSIRHEMEAQVKREGLVDDVIFTGNIPYQNVPALLSIADVAVAPYPKLPTELWFSPLKLFEYMAAAKAVVASRVGQITEVIEDGYSGLLVEPGNTEDLTRALTKLLMDAELRANLGDNARKVMMSSYSWQSHARQLEEIYRSVVPTN